MRLQGKKAIITGGGRGIGKAIAIGYAREGAKLIITYSKHQTAAEQVVDAIRVSGGQALALPLDISQKAQIPVFLSRALEFLGEINVLVNCAGIASHIPFLDISEEQLNLILETNFTCTFFLTQQIAKQMQQQQKAGSIINVSSISDEVATEGLVSLPIF